MGWAGPVTHRQFQAWEVWYHDLRWQETTPEHYYLAQIAKEAACSDLKASDKRKVKTERFLLKFSRTRKGLTKSPAEVAAEARKAHMSLFPAGSVTIVRKKPEEVEGGS